MSNSQKSMHRYIIRKYLSIKKRIKLLTSHGNKVHCPICGSHFSHFDTFGITHRKNAFCLNCGSLERHRLLWLYLNQQLNIFDKNKTLKLLHFAPEKMFYRAFSTTENIDYTPCDLDPKRYNYKGKVAVASVDITRIPFGENHFDAILCNHVLEHIPDDRLAMSELYRVLKPNGWAILQVPISGWGYFPKDIDIEREKSFEDFSITDSKEREKFFGQDDHVRLYGNDYKNRLEEVGFDVTVDSFVLSFSDEEQHRIGLMKSEMIYFCKKKA